MLAEALIVTAIASAMLGWNVHVMRKNGVSSKLRRSPPTVRTERQGKTFPKTQQQNNKLNKQKIKLFRPPLLSTRALSHYFGAQLAVWQATQQDPAW